jgi:hypothetical protein
MDADGTALLRPAADRLRLMRGSRTIEELVAEVRRALGA